MADKVILRGMETPEHVRRYFQAKEHPLLVFRVADLIDLDRDDQLLFLDILVKLGLTAPVSIPLTPDGQASLPVLRRKMQRIGFRGYVTISVDVLCRALDIESLAAFQAVVYNYDGVRKGKLEPSRSETCPKCGGKPQTPPCATCDGEGRILTLLEMSDLEIALASGKTWKQIDAAGIASNV